MLINKNLSLLNNQPKLKEAKKPLEKMNVVVCHVVRKVSSDSDLTDVIEKHRKDSAK